MVRGARHLVRRRMELSGQDLGHFVEDWIGGGQTYLPGQSHTQKLVRLASLVDESRDEQIGVGSRLEHLATAQVFVADFVHQ